VLLRKPAMIVRQGRTLWSHGNAALLDQPLDAVLCSKVCPGAKIIEAMDLAQRWRAENRSVISGFHTLVEKECLRIFLRGPQAIIVCPHADSTLFSCRWTGRPNSSAANWFSSPFLTPPSAVPPARPPKPAPASSWLSPSAAPSSMPLQAVCWTNSKRRESCLHRGHENLTSSCGCLLANPSAA
jgi:hypothetical protein